MLMELEQRLKIMEQALDASMVGIIITDPTLPDDPITYVNTGFELITGYTAQEVIGRNCRFLQGQQHDQPALRELRRALTEQRSCQVILHNYRKDGTLFWNELIISPVFDREGRLINQIGIQTDITRRKQAEENLRLNETLLSGIINSATDAVITLDAQHRIIIFNKAAEEIFGYSAQEMQGQTLDRLLPVEFRQSHQAFITRFGQKGITSRAMGNLAPLKALRKNGEEFPIEATISHLTINGQQLFTAVLRDVTARQQAAATLAKTEAQLRQAQKMEAVGRLAGGIAHDFNNLLTAITGYTELVLASVGQADPIYSDLQEISQAANRAAKLTRQLLTFSRQQLPQFQVLDLNEVVRGIHKLLARVIGEDVKLELQLDETPGMVRADLGQLEQVIINLAINARDAMPDGGILTLKIGKTNLAGENLPPYEEIKSGNYLVLTVQDTGTGMDEETVKHIFEPFFTTKGLGQGTGLGLSTVYGIIRQSGGFIEVQTTPGAGTTFQIHLPQVQQTDESVSFSQDSKVFLVSPGRGRETILVVEDAEAVRALMGKLLSRQGYNVLEAANAGEALLICESYQKEIELMITDVIMPRLNGRQLANRLSKLRPRMKVLYISGYNDRLILPEELQASSINFLPKPFAANELIQKVRQILDKEGD